VIGLRQGEISFNVPIEYYSIPQNLGITGVPPKEINARLRGSQRLLASIEPDRLRVHIELTHAHSGMNQVFLSEQNINLPSGITAIDFNPRKITLQLSPLPSSQRP
jgi:YbbR domain-containing protein